MEKNLPQLSFDGSVSLRETFAVSLNRRSASDGIARSTITHCTSVNSSSAKTRRNPFNFTTHPFYHPFRIGFDFQYFYYAFVHAMLETCYDAFVPTFHYGLDRCLFVVQMGYLAQHLIEIGVDFVAPKDI